MCFPARISCARVNSAPALHIDLSWKIGAGEGIRTLDPDLGKVVLYP